MRYGIYYDLFLETPVPQYWVVIQYCTVHTTVFESPQVLCHSTLPTGTPARTVECNSTYRFLAPARLDLITYCTVGQQPWYSRSAAMEGTSVSCSQNSTRLGLVLAISVLSVMPVNAFVLVPTKLPSAYNNNKLCGWLENVFPAPSDDSSVAKRAQEFPEQYPATYELSTAVIVGDNGDAKIVRPLLKNTQLENRPLRVVYNAASQGWNAKAFHKAVDGKGASIVLAKAKGVSGFFGGYNPKGWSGLGGARPSVAAFLFYSTGPENLKKLRKVVGGGLACAKDDPDTGIWLGPDGLVVPLQQGGQSKLAQSKLGTYFERDPQRRLSLFGESATVELTDLKVLVGVYNVGEEIPYSGAVLDFTSG